MIPNIPTVLSYPPQPFQVLILSLMPSIQITQRSNHSLCQSFLDGNLQTKRKVVDKAEAGEESEKKSSRSSTKKSSSRKTEESKKEESLVVGSGPWVEKELESVGLGAFAKSFGASLPLELLVFADAPHLDVLLRSSRTEPFPDIMDYIKLQCLIRSMHVRVTGVTGGAKKVKVSNFAIQPSPYAPYLNGPDSANHEEEDKAVRMKLLDGDIIHWTVDQVQQWLSSTPTLKQFAPAFLELKVDGRRLMSLSDRILLQKFKLENDNERAHILSHISDLKSLQLTKAASLHTEVLNKLIGSLVQEMGIGKSAISSALSNHSASSETASYSSYDASSMEKTDGEASDGASKTGSISSSLPAVLPSKRVPNYFLSLRIASFEIRENVIAIQREIANLIPDLAGSRSMLPPEQLHFTLGRLYLQTEGEVALAKRLLEESIEKVFYRLFTLETETSTRELAVNFKGVQNYGGNTVFLETERGLERDLLIEFGNSVYDLFQEAGLTSKEFRFQPVAPIIRVRQSKKPLLNRLQQVSQTLLAEKYAQAPLGRAIFSSVDISAVADQTDEDGYYKNLHTVALQ